MAIACVKKCHFLNAGRSQVTEERKNERLYTSTGQFIRESHRYMLY